MQATASVAPARVRVGARVRVEVAAEIRAGFHINSNRPAGEYLIPTELRLKGPAGLSLEKADYPSPHLESFSFSAEKIPVYDGKITIVAWLRTNRTGKQRLEFELAYQACNNQLCLPPTRIPVTADFEAVSEK